MSDTPRTDAEISVHDEAAVWVEKSTGYLLLIDLARTFERENAELCQQLDRYIRRSESGESLGDALDMAEELESLRKQLEQAEALLIKFTHAHRRARVCA